MMTATNSNKHEYYLTQMNMTLYKMKATPYPNKMTSYKIR